MTKRVITLGEKLDIIRKARGWTNKDLANALSASVASIGFWKKGSTVPREAMVLKIESLYLLILEEKEGVDDGEFAPTLKEEISEPDPESESINLSYLDEIQEAVRIAREQGGDNWHVLILPIPKEEELDIRIGIRKANS